MMTKQGFTAALCRGFTEVQYCFPQFRAGVIQGGNCLTKDMWERACPLPQRGVKCLLVPAQISVAHFFVTQQFLAGTRQADFAVDHYIGTIR